MDRWEERIRASDELLVEYISKKDHEQYPRCLFEKWEDRWGSLEDFDIPNSPNDSGDHGPNGDLSFPY